MLCSSSEMLSLSSLAAVLQTCSYVSVSTQSPWSCLGTPQNLKHLAELSFNAAELVSCGTRAACDACIVICG